MLVSLNQERLISIGLSDFWILVKQYAETKLFVFVSQFTIFNQIISNQGNLVVLDVLGETMRSNKTLDFLFHNLKFTTSNQSISNQGRCGCLRESLHFCTDI